VARQAALVQGQEIEQIKSTKPATPPEE